jgi:hypothetical protein
MQSDQLLVVVSDKHRLVDDLEDVQLLLPVLFFNFLRGAWWIILPFKVLFELRDISFLEYHILEVVVIYYNLSELLIMAKSKT